jgi:hypothetical protein
MNQTFGSQVGQLQKRVEFIRENRSLVGQLRRQDPAELARELERVLRTDAAQEALKGQKQFQAREAQSLLELLVSKAGAWTTMIRGALRDQGRADLLKALPKVASLTSYEAALGGLRTLESFVVRHASALQSLPRVNPKALRKSIASLAQAVRRKIEVARDLPRTTAELKALLRTLEKRTTAWLDVLAAAAQFSGNARKAAEIEHLRRGPARPRQTRAPQPTTAPAQG